MNIQRQAAVHDDKGVIVDAPVNARLVVTAGPGAGKTYTLLERASSLIDQGLEPAIELVVFSFSRAAVGAVAARSLAETDLGRLPVRTIDSFASSLLFDAGIDGEGPGYDGRIELARTSLNSERVRNRLASIRHVLVDEAQDVVGVRADFVKAFIEQLTANAEVGFTILGDEAQAIYDFEMSGSSSRLLDPGWLEKLDASTSTLASNYRMEPTRLAPLAKEFGDAIRHPGGDSQLLWSDLLHEINYTRGWDMVGNAAADLKLMARQAGDRTIGVLCRTNAEVLALGSQLQRKGVGLSVQHRAEDRGGAPWLALVFGRARFETARVPDEPDDAVREWLKPPNDLKRMLALAGLANRGEVQLGKLASMLRTRTCPEELLTRSASPVVLSTIHRAKGLEFDVVYVLTPRWSPRDAEEALKESRVLYVAMTRARTDLVGCPKLEFSGKVQQASDKKRAMTRHWSDKGLGRPMKIEVRVSDSDPNWYPRTPADYESVQKFLAGDLFIGDAMELHLLDGTPPNAPIYEIHHRGPYPGSTVVGVTGPEFAHDVAQAYPGVPPRVFRDVVAEIPDTTSFSPEISTRHGLPAHGLHLRARVFGLATPSRD